MLHGFSPGIVSQGASAYLLEQSLLFDGAAYLNRTPSVAGNRKTWTFSAWVKRATPGVQHTFFSARDDNDNRFLISFLSADTLSILQRTGAANVGVAITSSVFRDPSAWYHIVVAVDTTSATAGNRFRLYVNGTEITSFGTDTNISQNADTTVNSTVTHVLGRSELASPSSYFDGLMALPILVDGAALAPSDFGETDDGFWNPIEFTGATTTDANYSATVTAPNFGTDAEAVLGSDGDKTTIYDVQPGALAGVATSGRIAIKMDFGTAVTVTMAAITAKITAGSGFQVEIYYSSDDSTWTQFNSTYANLTSSYQDFATTGSQSARYWAATFSAGNHGSQTVTISDFRVFTDNASSFGTNGGSYNFADTTFFGKNISGTDDQAALSSATIGTSNWLDIPAAFTAGSGTLSRTSTAHSARSSNVLTGDFSITMNLTAGMAGFRCGVYAAAEDGTWKFADADAMGDATAMTDSYFLNMGAGNFQKGSATFGSTTQAAGTCTVVRVGSTITITAVNGTKSYAFTSAYTGPMRFMVGGGGVAITLTTLSWTADGQAGNSYFDTNFTTSDQLEDTPTSSADDGIGNFAVWDAGRSYLGNFALEEGNTKIVATAQDFGVPANIGVTSGKWYWEITALQLYCYFGIVSEASMGDTSDGSVAQFDGYGGEVYIYGRAGMKVSKSASQTAYGDSFTTNDVIGVAFDADNGTIWFSKNGTWQNSATTGEITAGTTTNAAYSSIDMSDYWYPHAHLGYTGDFCIANFGQSPFDYTPPTGYSALATQNLPAPTIADGSQYFNTVLYTGNGTAIGSGGNAITGVGFQPDLVWIKDRDISSGHILTDSVRGATNDLRSHLTAAENTGGTEFLASFDADGFTVGSNANVNTNTDDIVAWCWKAGGAAVSNTDYAVTSSVSANDTNGFAIVSFTADGVNNKVGTGFSNDGNPLAMAIGKNRSSAEDWFVSHSSAGNGLNFAYHMHLNATAATSGSGPYMFGTQSSSLTDRLTVAGTAQTSTDDFIVYLWKQIEGFSKFGSYTGNGSADGPFVYTGFRPAFILIKSTNNVANWLLFDTKRDTYNVSGKFLIPNLANAEGSGSIFDILSNGFKFRAVSSSYNGSGGEYIYAAFAEHPFQGDDGVTQARAR